MTATTRTHGETQPTGAASVVAPRRRSARDRLLDAANELFYAEGVQTVGIDRIIEHAGVAKGSLYNTFGSKEELVQAYLHSRHAETAERLTTAIAEHEVPRDRLLAVFDVQARLFSDPDFHGCAFASASAEAAPGGLVELAADEFRAWIRTMFTDLAREAVLDPDRLAAQLHMVYDGAGLSARMDRAPSGPISAAARAAAVALLDAAL